MNRAAGVFLLAACLGGSVVSADRLVIVQGGFRESPQSVLSVDVARLAVEWALPSFAVGLPVITSDGRYLAGQVRVSSLPEAWALWVRDLGDGSVRTLPLGSFGFLRLLAHPRRAELFGLAEDGAVVSISAQGLRTLAWCDYPTGLALSLDARRLLAVCGGNQLRVVDPDTGAVIARLLSGGSLPRAGLETNADGTRLFGIDGSALVIHDVDNGARLPGALSPPLPSAYTHAYLAGGTPARDAVFVTAFQFFTDQPGPDFGKYVSVVVNVPALTVRQTLPLDTFRGAFDVEVTPDGRTAFVAASGLLATAVVHMIDLPSNRQLVSSGPYASVSLALSPVPLAPTAVQAHGSGSQVTLTWTLPAPSPQVTHYVVEAGSGPGLRNLAVVSTGGSELTFEARGVPSGRYYVRVRGVNIAGQSDASNEVTVTVP